MSIKIIDFQDTMLIFHLRVKLMSSLENVKIRFNDGKCDPQGRLWAGKISLYVNLFVLYLDKVYIHN